MMQTLVSVTQKDIDLSLAGGHQCPIERALERMGIDAVVTPFSVHTKESPGRQAVLPREAKNFVRGFDLFKVAGPIRFPLEFTD